MELKAQAGDVVDVGPALVRHHVHPGHHAHRLRDGDVGAGVDQLAWEGQEHEGYGLCCLPRDKVGPGTLCDGVDTGPDVLPVCRRVWVTLTGTNSLRPQPGRHLPGPHRPLGAADLAAS